jgi:NADPH-dependent curcumin reductase
MKPVANSWLQALSDLIGLASSGELSWRETLSEGIETAPSDFLGTLKSRNFGKQLVKLR